MKMSYKPRTEAQKSRRRYLADCKEHNVKPMPIEDWKKAKISDFGIRCVTNKTSKPSCKSVKLAKKVCDKKPEKPITKKGRKIIVEREDVVIFKDYKPCDIMRFAMLMLVDVYRDICESNSRHNHNS